MSAWSLGYLRPCLKEKGRKKRKKETQRKVFLNLENIYFEGQVWWLKFLFPALERQRQLNLCELEAGLVYIASSRPVRVI